MKLPRTHTSFLQPIYNMAGSQARTQASSNIIFEVTALTRRRYIKIYARIFSISVDLYVKLVIL